jgi:hypothetical protein
MSVPPQGQAPPASGEDEFANVPSPRTRHPALALGTAALALFIIAHVRDDIAYSLSAGLPIAASAADATDLGDARELVATPGALDKAANHLVRIHGTPDRESALELDTKGSWVFTQFFRILGTGNRLFVHRRESPLPAFKAERDVFEGRLIRFRDLSFQAAIRGYSASHVSATHFFRPDDFRRAIAAPPSAPGAVLTLRDLAGDPVTLGPSDLLAVDLARPDVVRVGFPRDKFRDEAAARAEIEKRGGTVLSVGEAKAPPAEPAPLTLFPSTAPAAVDHLELTVRLPPERRDRALHELGDLDPKVEIRDARQTFKVRLGDLADGGDALLIKAAEGGAGAAPARLPLASIPAIRTLASVQIPDDAWLLIENDQPRDHAHTLIFGAVLLLFAAVNLINLAASLRGAKR